MQYRDNMTSCDFFLFKEAYFAFAYHDETISCYSCVL